MTATERERAPSSTGSDDREPHPRTRAAKRPRAHSAKKGYPMADIRSDNTASTPDGDSGDRWYVPGDRPWYFQRGALRRERWQANTQQMESTVVLPWAPEVMDVYEMPTDSPERRGTAQFRIKVRDQVRVVTDEEIERGTAWRQWAQFPGRNVREALASFVAHQAQTLQRLSPVAYWEDERLVLPDLTVVPEGYGRGPADRASFLELLALAATLPKIALLLGFSAAGPYIATMRPQHSFWVHLTGGGRKGKTSALTAAASLWGTPELGSVVRPWDVTPRGLSVYLGRLRVLPHFRDELGAAEYKPSQLKGIILATCQGNVRDVSGRAGDMRSGSPWHGTLISTGNVSILSQLTDEAIAARVIELPVPFTADAATADRVSLLALQAAGYGWELADRWHDLPGFFHDLSEAHADLGSISGGIPGTIARNLTVGLAGCAWLERVTEVRGLRDAALAAAREVLEMLVAEITETGISPGARLLEALESAMMQTPSAWPKAGAPVPAGVTVSGYLLGSGRVGVIPAALDPIARDGGLETSRPAVRELRSAVILEPGDGQHLAKRVKVGTSRPRMFVFRLPHIDQVPDTVPDMATPPVATDPAMATAPVATGQTVATPPATGGHPVATPAPRRAPGRRAAHARPAGDLQAFAKAVQTRYPDEELDGQALAHAHQGLADLLDMEIKESPATAGAMLFFKHQAQHGAKPELEKVAVRRPDQVVNSFNFVNPSAYLDNHRAVTAVDVNAQYLAAAGSVELGSGEPEWLAVGADKTMLKQPGYVRLAEPLAWPVEMPAGTWITTPFAQYLDSRGLLPRTDQVMLWFEHRRWLGTWARTLREARGKLVPLAEMNPAARYALVYVKQMYSGFLGGMLRSEHYNHTSTLRPDWSDMVVGTAWANAFRAMDKADRPALGIMKDTLYYGVESVGEVPGGLIMTDQPGKFDPAKIKTVGMTMDIAAAIEAARPAKLRDAVNAEWKQVNGG